MLTSTLTNSESRQGDGDEHISMHSVTYGVKAAHPCKHVCLHVNVFAAPRQQYLLCLLVTNEVLRIPALAEAMEASKAVLKDVERVT